MTTVPFVEEGFFGEELILTELLKVVTDWAMTHIRDTNIYNESFGHDIVFNKKGLRHTIRAKGFRDSSLEQKNRDHLTSIAVLQDIVQQAVHVETLTDYKGRDNLVGFHVFESKVQVGDRLYEVEVKVREVVVNVKEPTKKFFYEHYLIK